LKEFTIARLDASEHSSDDEEKLTFPADGQGVISALSLPVQEDDQEDAGIDSDDTWLLTCIDSSPKISNTSISVCHTFKTRIRLGTHFSSWHHQRGL
jgi:hypothetical protein